MRHRRRGRKLGRNPKHQRALLRNLASALMLTERDAEGEPNPPKVKGRIITTLHKAKEVRPLVERCITIARRALPHQEAAERLEPDAERDSESWRAWRRGKDWQEWNHTIAPVVAARRRLVMAIPRLGDAAPRAVLELVATHDRVRRRAPKPTFEPQADETAPAEKAAVETSPADEAPLTDAEPEADVEKDEDPDKGNE